MPPSALVSMLVERDILDRGDQFERLLGGRTNRVWKVVGSRHSSVLKLYRVNGTNPLFRNDPTLERICLNTLAHKSLAPKLHESGVWDGTYWLLYDHAPGMCWTSNPRPVARMLHRLHTHPVPKDVPDGCNGSHELWLHADTILGECSKSASSRIWSREPRQHIAPYPTRTLIHGDPVPGNILVQNNQAMLIDWQCPAVGDPAEDLAMFLSPAMQLLYRGTPLSDSETQVFLDAYPNREVTQRYHEVCPWFHWRMAAYCLWRLEKGETDYAKALELELQALDAA